MSKVLATLMLVGLLGCGSSDDEAAEAKDKCRALVTNLCTRFSGCTSGNATECQQAVATQIDCTRAAAVGGTYDTCMAEVQTFQCSVIASGGRLTLPASCKGVIKVPQE